MHSPTDAASQEHVAGLAQRVVVVRARAPRDAAVQHCLEESARSVVQFEGVLPEAAPCVAYAPVDLDGQIGIVVDVPPEVYKLVRLNVAADSDIPFSRKHMNIHSTCVHFYVNTNANIN